METIEIIGYKRANLGKRNSNKLREEGNVPCVVYGGDEQIHFHAPMILFRELVYTPGANFVRLNIEGIEKDAILQEVSFAPPPLFNESYLKSSLKGTSPHFKESFSDLHSKLLSFSTRAPEKTSRLLKISLMSRNIF